MADKRSRKPKTPDVLAFTFAKLKMAPTPPAANVQPVAQPDAKLNASGFRFATLKPSATIPKPIPRYASCATCRGIVRNDGVGIHDPSCAIWQELGNGVTGIASAHVTHERLPNRLHAMTAIIPDHGTVTALSDTFRNVQTWCDGCRSPDCAACAWLWARLSSNLSEESLPF